MNLKKKIIIFKNDAVGDLVQSLQSINNITKKNSEDEIIIYLSERSKNFSFLIEKKNINVKILNYNLSLSEKIQIFKFLLINDIDEIYILTPKKFYFYLPLFFRKIRFYGLCINSTNNYKRPANFLRKFLYKFVINDRGTVNKRKSTMDLQNELTNDNQYNQKYKINTSLAIKYHDTLNIKNYIYFHLKLSNFKKLGWGYKELKIILNEFLKYTEKVIFTRDLESNNDFKSYQNDFNIIDFLNGEKKNNHSKIYLYDNISGIDLFNVINRANKVVAFHGMMTNLASINKNHVLDLFLCEIKSINDYRRYKNAFYEFKPVYKNYDFIIPSKDLNKTIRKMKFFLKK